MPNDVSMPIHHMVDKKKKQLSWRCLRCKIFYTCIQARMHNIQWRQKSEREKKIKDDKDGKKKGETQNSINVET